MKARKQESEQGEGMTSDRGFGRRDFMRRGAVVTTAAGAGTIAGGTLMAQAVSGGFSGAGLAQLEPLSQAVDTSSIASIRLMATDGHFSFPGRRSTGALVFGFGFRAVDDARLRITDTGHPDYPGGELDANPGDLISKYKGKVHHTAPTIVAIEGEEMAIVVTNLGLLGRPDLDDAHSLHWHGFRNATAVFDGVPETSISVPSGRDLPYFFDLKTADQLGQAKGSAGTYMYHCHFEDTEHVQMGMTGVVFVEPRDMWFRPDGTTPWYATGNATDMLQPDYDDVVGSPTRTAFPQARRKVAYNDNPAGIDTSFDREFAFLLNEIDTTPHDNLEGVQEFVWSDYDPNYWTINGRSYPDTVIPQIVPQQSAAAYQDWLQMPVSPAAGDEAAEAEMLYQHNSSLIQCQEGDRVLLRMANLGYEIHSMDLVGIDMEVVAHDASLLMGRDGTTDLTYTTQRVQIGPGEGRDIIFTAPAYVDGSANDDDLALRGGYTRRFNRYLLKSRNHDRQSNDGTLFGDGVSYAGADDTYGGMVTELWVYPNDTNAGLLTQDPLPTQYIVNETFPTLVVPNDHV